jgi:hypothetical protein
MHGCEFEDTKSLAIEAVTLLQKNTGPRESSRDQYQRPQGHKDGRDGSNIWPQVHAG